MTRRFAKLKSIPVLTGASVVVLLMLMIPIARTVAPEAHIQVLDTEGTAAAGVRAQQDWADFSSDGQRHVAFTTTDAHGVLNFPRRTTHAPLIWRVFNILLTSVKAAFHGNSGVYSTITVFDRNDPTIWTFEMNSNATAWPDKMQLSKSEIIMKPDTR